MGKVILAVDDAPSILYIVESIFQNDHKVVLKKNANDALAWLEEGNLPDIIITDINMPGMDGWAFICQLKSSGYFRSIPIIVLSGNDSSSDRIKYLQGGVEDVVQKPFNPVELKMRVDNILRRVEKVEKATV
jgi:two-component system, chemotaxis family, chemotaxis protein CheY